MLLADLGAEVLRIERAEGNGWPNPIVDRGCTSLVIDIRSEEGRALALKAADKTDVLIEGFRPGVMERLGLGPDLILARNPRLIYGRVTGWGQSGPLAQAAGHDINYIALTGALAAIGKPGESAVPPLNLVGDFGGGSMFLAFGIMAALWERERSGKGQVVDAAIIDGVNSLMTMFAGLVPTGRVSVDRSRSLLGGAAPFYRCYICADGKEIAIGALEPKFYDEFINRIQAPESMRLAQYDQTNWLERSETFAALFRSKSSTEWAQLLEGTDACFALVMGLTEAPSHPQNIARHNFIEHEGLLQSSPAPRFSRTPGVLKPQGRDGGAVIEAWYSNESTP
jgi:alpha-methylacyl-CoA racemase